jgi:thioesterase domain-containing protein
VTLLRTARHIYCAHDDLNWGRLLRRPPEIRLIPGDHETIMSEPHVRETARQLQRCLDRI